MALDLKKFLDRFVDEARDHLTRLEEGLTALEQGGSDAELINVLFRAAHTLKGSSRMLKLVSITETAHQVEEVLGALRDRRISFTPELSSVLFRAVDALHALVERIPTVGRELPPPDPELGAALLRAAAGEALSPVPLSFPPPSLPSVSLPQRDQVEFSLEGAGNTRQRIEEGSVPPVRGHSRMGADTVRVRLEKLDELLKFIGEMVSQQAKFRQRVSEISALDRLMQQVERTVRDSRDTQLAEVAQMLHRLARQWRYDVEEQERFMERLSDQALTLRMSPLSQIFELVSRAARELARSLGKEVRCEVSGAEIELDRQLIDRLHDVLTHLVHNAVDHGLETPEERQDAGKSPMGRVRIAARQEGTGVVIEVADDGRGLDREKILARAAQKGLIDSRIGTTLTDEQVADLIFQPGLSTSTIITELSGRGVGMDVVRRTLIDELHGAIAVSSRPGQGTTFVCKVPLSLILMPVVLFEAAQRKFALAAHHIVELAQVTPETALTIADRPALVVRNEFVPLVSLAELLGLPGRPVAPGKSQGFVAVIGVQKAKLGILVDRLLDEGDKVIKPLPEHLRHLSTVGGLVVTEANELVSVLQAPALMEMTRRVRRVPASLPEPSTRPKSYHILVVDDSLNTREIEKELLEACGYRVTLAEDGFDGWRKALHGHFDAILTDVEMPGMDGFTLTAKLREHEKYQATPIIIVTSRAKEEDRRRGIQVGADAYIVKGDFEQSSLTGALQNLLG